MHHRPGLCRTAACTRVSPGHLRDIGFDVDADKIRELPIGNDNPNISFTDNTEDINNADFIIIAVPTPVTKSKDPDLSYIESAARTKPISPTNKGISLRSHCRFRDLKSSSCGGVKYKPIHKNECRLHPPRQPHTHLRRHRPKFIMNAPVKLQQHDAIYDSANRHRNQCQPDAGERHHQTVGANEQPHHR